MVLPYLFTQTYIHVLSCPKGLLSSNNVKWQHYSSYIFLLYFPFTIVMVYKRATHISFKRSFQESKLTDISSCLILLCDV